MKCGIIGLHSCCFRRHQLPFLKMMMALRETLFFLLCFEAAVLSVPLVQYTKGALYSWEGLQGWGLIPGRNMRWRSKVNILWDVMLKLIPRYPLFFFLSGFSFYQLEPSTSFPVAHGACSITGVCARKTPFPALLCFDSVINSVKFEGP